MIVVIARYSLKAGSREQYLQAIDDAQIIEQCRDEAGNISYEFLCSPHNPDEIVVLERWQDEEALTLHGTLPHFAQMLEIKQRFNPTPSVVEKYEAQLL